MATPAASRISAPLVEALEATWAAIVKRHPDVPSAVLVVASGTDGRKASEARWGHFAALRWVQGDAQLPEVLVAGAVGHREQPRRSTDREALTMSDMTSLAGPRASRANRLLAPPLATWSLVSVFRYLTSRAL